MQSQYKLDHFGLFQETLSQKIKQKQNASLILALTLAQMHETWTLLDTNASLVKQQQKSAQDLFRVTQILKQDSHYKNTWIQMIDAHGVSRYRSWTDKKGDSLINARPDIRSIDDDGIF
jgi:hypothetical protein